MNLFWNQCKKNNIELEAESPPSASAFCQARYKVDPKIILKSLKECVEQFESLFGENYLWKGHRIFAVDGTKYTLPASEELIEKFGCQNCGNVDAHYPQSMVSVLFNVKSKIAYDVVVEDIKGNEREMLKKFSNSIKSNDLLILDRGYPSYDIITFLMKKRIDFLMRCNITKTTFYFLDNFIKSEAEDEIIEFQIPDRKDRLRLRALKSKNENGEMRVFLTTLLDQKEYSYQEMVDLYYERWEIETHYKVNKELFKVESFHSKKEIGILQEIYSQLVLSNLTRQSINFAEQVNQGKKGEPSFKNAVLLVEDYLSEIMLAEDEEEVIKHYNDLLDAISRVRYKKRKGRHFPRKSHQPVPKWSIKKSLT